MIRLIFIMLAMSYSALCAAALPEPVRSLLLNANVPANSAAIYVQEVGSRHPLLTHRDDVPMNPASTMKLLTTYAALELLGPSYVWRTEIYTDGEIEKDSVLGNLIIKGSGDPKITVEKFWLLVRDLRTRGIREIRGDLILDRSLFAGARHDPAQFDNEPLRPYNVGPDALLVNFKAVRFTFTPNEAEQTVLIRAEPHPAGLTVKNNLKLRNGNCGDWRSAAQAAFSSETDSAEALFNGQYALSCGEKTWYVSLFDHPNFVAGFFRQLWEEMGGVWSGKWRDGTSPKTAKLLAQIESYPLTEVIRDVNKFSNNVMARQIYLTLAAHHKRLPATAATAREAIGKWLLKKGLNFPELVIENGSGLSRVERISAGHLGRLLYAAYMSPVMPELIASMPVAAYDGTMSKRLKDGQAAGQAHLKTGSLDGVRALAGYVLDAEGRRYVIVFLVNHTNAANAQKAMDALINWIYQRSEREALTPQSTHVPSKN